MCTHPYAFVRLERSSKPPTTARTAMNTTRVISGDGAEAKRWVRTRPVHRRDVDLALDGLRGIREAKRGEALHVDDLLEQTERSGDHGLRGDELRNCQSCSGHCSA